LVRVVIGKNLDQLAGFDSYCELPFAITQHRPRELPKRGELAGRDVGFPALRIPVREEQVRPSREEQRNPPDFPLPDLAIRCL